MTNRERNKCSKFKMRTKRRFAVQRVVVVFVK